jgi:hypothetical protein
VLPAGQWMTVTRWPPAGAPAAGLANPGQNTQRIGHAVAGQCDIVFAITKSGLRCMAPMCNKPLCPWTTCPRDNQPFFSRINHRFHHAGMRGAPGSNNILCGFGLRSVREAGNNLIVENTVPCFSPLPSLPLSQWWCSCLNKVLVSSAKRLSRHGFADASLTAAIPNDRGLTHP